MPHSHSHSSPQPLNSITIPTPRIVFWETTGDCNLRCVHCRREWTSAPSHELSSAQASNLIDQIADTQWGSILVFSGGEPLMRADLFELLEHARSRHVPVALATNATLVNADIAQRLARASVPRVSVSLDGPTAAAHDAFRGQQGSFDAAISGIRALRSAGIDVQINVTFTRNNRSDALAMLDLAQQLDTCAMHVFSLVPVGCGIDLPDSIRLSDVEVEGLLTLLDTEATARDFEIRATCAPQAQRIRRQRAAHRKRTGEPEGRGLAPSSKGCLAGGGILFVDAVGKVFPCGYLPIAVGGITTQNIKAILETSTLLAQLRDVSLLEGRCKGCDFAPVCGGCRARSYGACGNLFGEEPTCPMNVRR